MVNKDKPIASIEPEPFIYSRKSISVSNQKIGTPPKIGSNQNILLPISENNLNGGNIQKFGQNPKVLGISQFYNNNSISTTIKKPIQSIRSSFQINDPVDYQSNPGSIKNINTIKFDHNK